MTAQLNAAVIQFVSALSAHSDVVEALYNSTQQLGSVDVIGDLKKYRAPLFLADDVAFACATGMNGIHYRLPQSLRETALQTGAVNSDIGGEWVTFSAFRSDWPAMDFVFWSRKAYAYAKSLASNAS